MASSPRYHEIQHRVRSYTVGWFAPLACERAAAEALRDEVHGPPTDFRRAPDDHLEYSWGKIGDHNFVLASLGAGTDGLVATAQAATRMLASFPGIRFSLLVGIGGAIPRFDREGEGVYQLRSNPDVRLGDIVVSQPNGNGGVIQYDHYKATNDGPQEKGYLDRPPPALLYGLAALQAKQLQGPSNVPSIIAGLEKKNDYMVNKRGYKHPGQEKDRLFYPSYGHPAGDLTCENCSVQHEVKRRPREDSDPEVHYGTIASGNVVVKNAEDRENLIKHHPSASKCLCYEMEAAGVMNNFPCLVIRGICDYSDSHKNDVWHNYAALVAAAFAKELLLNMARDTVKEAVMAKDWMQNRVKMMNEIERTLKTTNTYSKNAEIQSTLQDVNLDIKEAGQWFLDGSKFQHWRNSCGSLLWVYGLPGSGKTVLSASVINYLESNLARENMSKVVLYYYFDIQESKKGENLRPMGCMLRSFLIQLSRTHDYILEDLCKRFETRRELCESELTEILFQVTKLFSDVKIVIDALDEMEDRQRETVCGWITETLKLYPDRFSFLVTSRRERDIEDQFHRKCESLKILEMSAGCDIEKYVLARIKEYQLNKGQRWSQESLRKIQDVLLRRADGMFRWVVCQLDQLLDHPQTESFGDDEIDEVLRTLPRSLIDTYDRILERIPNGTRKDNAYRLLQFLLFCKRRIRALVANEFLSVAKCSEFNVSMRIKYPLEITRDCSSLVTLRGPHSQDSVDRSPEIFLAHPSVRDYLLSNRVLGEGQVDLFGQIEANKFIFKTCLRYIYFLSMPNVDPYNQDSHEFPLAAYATDYLFEHASAAGKDEEIVDAATALCWNEDTFCTWVCHRSRGAAFYFCQKQSIHAWRDFMKASARYTAACYGLKDYLQASFERESYHVCKITSKYAPFGFWMTGDLLKKGTRRFEWSSISPLYIAAKEGHEDVVRMLIKAGVTIDEVGGPGGTAFDVACHHDCVGAVEALLEKGKRRSNSTMSFEGVLQQAVRTGSLQLVQAFLNHGFLTHGTQPSIESAIFDAAFYGNTAVTQELLRHCRGLHPLAGMPLSLPLSLSNTLSFLGWLSAWIPDIFSWSSGNSHKHSALQPLESYGGVLDPMSKYNYFRKLQGEPVDRVHLFSTALQASVFENHEEIVEALLKEGRDPNATGGYFGTALQAAAAEGSLKLVQRLLDAGADPNITGGFFKTPLNASLMTASWATLIQQQDSKRTPYLNRYTDPANYKNVVAALLKAGAQPHRGGEEMKCALKLKNQDVALMIIHAFAQQPDAVSLLNAKDSSGMTAIHYAAQQRVSSETMKHLLHASKQAGILIECLDARNNDGRTALHYARHSIYDKASSTVELLIDAAAGAGILAGYLNVRDDRGETALHRAASYQDVRGVTLLLRAGADEEAMNLDKQSFVDRAREGGRVGRLFDVRPEAIGPFCSSIEEARAIASAVLLHHYVQLNDVAAVKKVAEKTTFHRSFLDIPDAGCGMTLLHHAAEKGYIALGELLLDLGAQQESVDKEEMTPLHRAAKSGCLKIVTAILQRIGNKEKENRSLFSVTDFREDDFNGFLTGKPSDRQDASGSTPLHYAVQNESIEMVKSLVHCGATVYRRNTEGNTPRDLALGKREAFDMAEIKMPCDITAVNLIAKFLEEDEKYDYDS